MTRRTLIMPRLGETMEEGTIAAWLVTPGTAFKRGEPILEVETDKTVVEYPALGDGVLLETLVLAGELVAVGAPIASIEAEVWEDPVALAVAPEPSLERNEPALIPVARRSADGPLRATPVARRLARQSGISLETITGTGRRGRIEAWDVRQAGSDAVLLVHGFAGDSTAWAALTAALTRAGHRVLTPDLPGHGADRTTPTGLAELSAALAAVASTEVSRLHLVGHSLGAYLAAVYAADNPSRVASLTLIAPAGLGPGIERDFIHGMAEAKNASDVAQLLRLLGPKGAALSSPVIANMAAKLSQGRLKPLAAAICGPSGQRIDTLAALARLPKSVPVRALIGAEDKVIPPTHLFNLPARVAIHVLPTGHMPQWDAPAEVGDIVMEAIRNA
jgi:pyruvate dehydrogenase E2 component (dihydrolipoamide acetyltransferase)